MQPDQQPANNYDFILNPQQNHPKRSLGGGNLGLKLLVIIGGIFVVVVAVVLLMRALGGSNGLNKPALLSVAQDQTELIRLSSTGTQDSGSQSNKNFSITTKLTVSADQKEFLAYLAKFGYKPDSKDLALKQSAQVDKQLTDARSASNFDVAYHGVMKQALGTYQRDLNAAYNTAGPEGRELLKKYYNSANLLMTQLEQ